MTIPFQDNEDPAIPPHLLALRLRDHPEGGPAGTVADPGHGPERGADGAGDGDAGGRDGGHFCFCPRAWTAKTSNPKSELLIAIPDYPQDKQGRHALSLRLYHCTAGLQHNIKIGPCDKKAAWAAAMAINSHMYLLGPTPGVPSTPPPRCSILFGERRAFLMLPTRRPPQP